MVSTPNQPNYFLPGPDRTKTFYHQPQITWFRTNLNINLRPEMNMLIGVLYSLYLLSLGMPRIISQTEYFPLYPQNSWAKYMITCTCLYYHCSSITMHFNPNSPTLVLGELGLKCIVMLEQGKYTHAW